MKVCGYTSLSGYFDRPTGVGKHIDQMLHGLRDAGHRVSVLASASELPAPLPASHALHDLPVRLIPGTRRSLEWRWKLLGRPYIDEWADDADWIYLGYEKAVRVRKARLAATIHSLYWFDPDAPGYHSWGYRRFRLYNGPVFRYLGKRADVILTVSEFLKRQITQWLKVPEDRIAVVGNGVEEDYYRIAHAPQGISGQPSDLPYVLCVGGLNDLDGGAYILDVAESLMRTRSPVRVLVAGWQNNPLYVARARSLNNVECLGYVGKERLAPLMRDAVALLYLNRYETFGMAAAESMAAGTPVIGTNFTAIPEVVASAGIIADVANSAQTADCIGQLANNQALRAEYTEKGRARAEQFRWSACVARLEEQLRR